MFAASNAFRSNEKADDSRMSFKLTYPGIHRLPDGMRIYAIGDVHGRADLLEQVFSAIDNDLERSPARRALHVFLGDYIDRGPASRQVIDLLIKRGRIHELVLLKGNHEAFALEFIRDSSTLVEWSGYGGFQTLISYGLAPSFKMGPAERQELSERFARVLFESGHSRFLASLRNSFACGDFFFAHAGVKPGIQLAHQRDEDLLWIRDDFLLYEERFEKMIVHGHTPVGEPDFRSNRINIDTGAYATGKLTCLIIDHELATLMTRLEPTQFSSA
jgi:serine/threonine protein phosphatase 1